VRIILSLRVLTASLFESLKTLHVTILRIMLIGSGSPLLVSAFKLLIRLKMLANCLSLARLCDNLMRTLLRNPPRIEISPALLIF
jgi:hypothetical protein